MHCMHSLPMPLLRSVYCDRQWVVNAFMCGKPGTFLGKYTANCHGNYSLNLNSRVYYVQSVGCSLLRVKSQDLSSAALLQKVFFLLLVCTLQTLMLVHCYNPLEATYNRKSGNHYCRSYKDIAVSTRPRMGNVPSLWSGLTLCHT